jgi:hypothetical protein
VSYCDEDCQKPHWKYHKQVCKAQGTDLSPAAQKTQNVAVSQNVIPAAADPPSDETDEKENFFLPCVALRQALQGKQAKWAEKHSVRKHLQNHIWPSQVQNWIELEYGLKPGLDAFFKNKVALKALDLGAGICSNVAVLVDVGFVHITAVDNLAGFKELAGKTVQALKLEANNELLEVALLEKSITPEDSEIFPRNASLGAIIARKTFEFCAPNDFEKLLIASYDSLEQGGCFIVSVNLLDSTKPDLYDPYWKGGEWGFTSQKEVKAAEEFLKSLGFEVRRLNSNRGPNNPEVLFFCTKF